MKNMVMFTAKDFARVISAGRKFMDKKKGTSFAAEICNQFIIEVIEEKEKNRREADRKTWYLYLGNMMRGICITE